MLPKKLCDVFVETTAVSQKDIEKFANEEIAQISCDSRKIIDCDSAVLFFAIVGARSDGHMFIDDVLKKNRHAIIVSETNISHRCNRSIRANDINAAVAVAAKSFFCHPDESMNVVAVTGTNGKTTSAYLCRAMLNRISKTGMLGTIEYDVGGEVCPAVNTTPMAIDLFMMLDDARKNLCKNVVLEASSHALAQKRMYNLDVDIALFTNLTQDHLDFHGKIDNYFVAKKKLFNGENGHVPRMSVINTDDKYGKLLYDELIANGINCSSFGKKKCCDFMISNVEENDIFGVKFSIHSRGKTFNLSSHLFGDHNMYNIAGSFAACMSLYDEPEIFASALSGFTSVPGRMEKVALPTGVTAFVDYAHTPDGLHTVISSLRNVMRGPGRLITVFGCGGDRDRTKRAPMTEIANKLSDFSIATSDNPRNENIENVFDDMSSGVVDESKISFVPCRADAILQAIKIASKGDVILIAGKGHETYQIIGNERRHFDDKEAIASAAKTLGML